MYAKSIQESGVRGRRFKIKRKPEHMTYTMME